MATNKELAARIAELEAQLATAQSANTATIRCKVGPSGTVVVRGAFGRNMQACFYPAQWPKLLSALLGDGWEDTLGGTDLGCELRRLVRMGCEGEKDEKGRPKGSEAFQALVREAAKASAAKGY